MIKNKLFTGILQIILYVSAVIYLISCSSSENDKYNLITEKEKKAIDEFCKCTEPVQPLFEKLSNALNDSANMVNFMNDSNYMKQLTDSLDIMMKEVAPCFKNSDNMFESHNIGKEREKQFLSYFKKYYPKCMLLVLGERRSDLVKYK